MTLRRALVLITLLFTFAVAVAACGGNDDSSGEDDGGGGPTPTPEVNPFQVCIAHFEVDVADDPDIANMLLLVMLTEFWTGGPVSLDGFNGALYADYHVNFDGAEPPDHVAAISTNATVVVTGSGNQLGDANSVTIESDALWFFTTGTAGMLSGGDGSATGILQNLADCTAGNCEYGTGGVNLLVQGSALTVGESHPDGVTLLYCRNLPTSLAAWKPGEPLPREILERR